jgi:hypothetical protein
MNGGGEYSDLCCAPSSTFMPYEEGEGDIGAAGLLSRVVDAVNTTKDIVYVI